MAEAVGPTAHIDLDVYPHKIHIRSDVLNSLTAEELQATIAHEVGHRIGLANTSSELCGTNPSIMNGHDENNVQVTREVKSEDVYKSNRSADPNTTNNCTQTPPPTAADPSPTPTPTPEPTPEPTATPSGEACEEYGAGWFPGHNGRTCVPPECADCYINGGSCRV